MKIYRYFILALGIIVVDQTSKLLVYKYMYLHQEINVIGEWFRLHYLLNPGMAFGIRWNNEFGKLALTAFRIAAMVGIGYYLWKMAYRKAHPGFLWCMALILGGAVGNVIDSIFYGVVLNNHPAESPTPWFHGQVIDMLFFPIFDFYWPDWVPFVGGDYFLFFSPVFNIADSSIFVGVVVILFWQRVFFREKTDTIPVSLPSQDNINGTQSGVPDRTGVRGSLSEESPNKESF
ncbi:MAG TPA: lipoprotein signal peptidase [Chryseosolibacter sp.]|nr:lipoprotein signal peptidase [Chryseosolibacter sp.]